MAVLRVPASVDALTAAVGLAAFASLTQMQVGLLARLRRPFGSTRSPLSPDSYVAYNNLGFYLARTDDEEDAGTGQRVFRSKSLRINATFPDAQNNLGHTLAREGKLQEAIKYYSRRSGAQPSRLHRFTTTWVWHWRVWAASTKQPTISEKRSRLGRLIPWPTITWGNCWPSRARYARPERNWRKHSA